MLISGWLKLTNFEELVVQSISYGIKAELIIMDQWMCKQMPIHRYWYIWRKSKLWYTYWHVKFQSIKIKLATVHNFELCGYRYDFEIALKSIIGSSKRITPSLHKYFYQVISYLFYSIKLGYKLIMYFMEPEDSLIHFTSIL